MVAIRCVGLSRRFGALAAVAGLDLEVGAGEFFALLGPNGAGKTTTLHLLTTLLSPSEGEAYVLEHHVVREAEAVRRSIGIVFQDPALDERLTAWENLEVHAFLYGLPLRSIRTAVLEALAWASLEEAALRPVHTFSGGMKRRLELARALMHRPRVLFLDEPTLGLDPQGRRQLWERVEALRQEGLTVFLTTHYLLEAEAADRVGILDRGRLVALGSPRELKRWALGREEGSLEEVFLALTGRVLRDEEATTRERFLSYRKRGGEHSR
jgi:ABC-2 type transport system ATP-binding protein